MWKLSLVLALVGSAAFADSKKDIDKLVRVQLTHDKLGEGLGKDTLVLVDGRQVTENLADEAWDIHADAQGMKFVSTVQGVEIVADDARGIAWFHARAKFVETMKGYSHTANMRLSGIALASGKTWRLAMLAYTQEWTDAKMLAAAKAHKPPFTPPATPSFEGDATLAKLAASWFTETKLAKAGATKRIASGTSTGEYGVDAAATKLATGWDKLKLPVASAFGKTFGDIGVVTVKVGLQVPKTPAYAPMILCAVVVKNGDTWQWTSLNWASIGILDPPQTHVMGD
jgi:hypothetical protein